jgi:hypothetical protein
MDIGRWKLETTDVGVSGRGERGAARWTELEAGKRWSRLHTPYCTVLSRSSRYSYLVGSDAYSSSRPLLNTTPPAGLSRGKVHRESPHDLLPGVPSVARCNSR